MTQSDLQRVADSLERAAEATKQETAQERLRKQSTQFRNLAESDAGADHGKLARHEHILTEIAEDAPETGDYIDEALGAIRAYRETIEGV